MNVVQGALYFTFEVELNRVIRDNVFKIAMMLSQKVCPKWLIVLNWPNIYWLIIDIYMPFF